MPFKEAEKLSNQDYINIEAAAKALKEANKAFRRDFGAGGVSVFGDDDEYEANVAQNRKSSSTMVECDNISAFLLQLKDNIALQVHPGLRRSPIEKWNALPGRIQALESYVEGLHAGNCPETLECLAGAIGRVKESMGLSNDVKKQQEKDDGVLDGVWQWGADVFEANHPLSSVKHSGTKGNVDECCCCCPGFF